MHIPQEVRDELRGYIEAAFRDDATDEELKESLGAMLELAERYRRDNPELARVIESQAEVLANRMRGALGEDAGPLSADVDGVEG